LQKSSQTVKLKQIHNMKSIAKYFPVFLLNSSRHLLVKALCMTAILASASARGQQATYDWVSTDGDPYGFGGTIVLDSTSGVNGTVNDIISMTLFDTFSGTYVATLPSDISVNGYFIALDWNPTTITDIELGAANNSTSQAFYLEDGIIADPLQEVADFDGSWQRAACSAVPDSLPMMYPGIVILAMGMFGLQHRRNQVVRGVKQ
jgi:hypothetical protein